MKSNLLKGGSALLALAAITMLNLPALAETTVTETTVTETAPVVTQTTTTTTTSAPVILASAIVTVPTSESYMLVMDNETQQKTVVQSNLGSQRLTYFVTEGDGSVSIVATIKPRPFHVIRRDELLARIVHLRNIGQLGASDADMLTGGLVAADNLRKQMPLKTETRGYYELNQNVNYAFDNVANDIRDAVHMRDSRVAGSYSYIML